MASEFTYIHGSTAGNACGGGGVTGEWSISIAGAFDREGEHVVASSASPGIFDVPSDFAARIPRGAVVTVARDGFHQQVWVYFRREEQPGVVRLWCRRPDERRQRFLFRTRRRA